MNELTNEVTEEIVIRELTISELESVNGGAVVLTALAVIAAYEVGSAVGKAIYDWW